MFVSQPPGSSLVSCVKGKDMANSFCMKSVEKRIVKYGRISERRTVGDPTDFAHSIAKYLPFSPKPIINNTDRRFKIQKPILENSNRRELPHFQGSGIIKPVKNVIVSKNVVSVTGSSFHSVKEELIAAGSPSGCLVKQVRDMREFLFTTFLFIAQHNNITSATPTGIQTQVLNQLLP